MAFIVYDPIDSCIWGTGKDYPTAMQNAEDNISIWEIENLDTTRYAQAAGSETHVEYYLLPRNIRTPERLVVLAATTALVEQVREEGCVKAFSIENGIADKIKSA